jgi:hypothetical protein
MAKKNKKSALAVAASKKLARIGAPDPEEVAHAMWHAEERGEVERVSLDDGSWAWAFVDGDGQTKMIKPTEQMLMALARFERERHLHNH